MVNKFTALNNQITFENVLFVENKGSYYGSMDKLRLQQQ